MKISLRLATVLFMLVMISGCRTLYEAKMSGENELNLSQPNVLPGQIAYVYGGWRSEYLKKSLEDTGLFKSVQITESRQPLATGVYISVELSNSDYSSGNVLAGLLTVLSLGLIPDFDAGHYNELFTISVYQDGALLTTRNESITLHNASGLFAPFIGNEKLVWQRESQLLVNSMIHGLNARRR